MAQLGHGPARPAHASGLLRPPHHRTLTRNPHRHLSLPPHDPHHHSLVSLPHPRSRSGSRGTNPTSPRPLGEPRRPSPPRRRSFPPPDCLILLNGLPPLRHRRPRRPPRPLAARTPTAPVSLRLAPPLSSIPRSPCLSGLCPRRRRARPRPPRVLAAQCAPALVRHTAPPLSLALAGALLRPADARDQSGCVSSIAMMASSHCAARRPPRPA